MRIHVTSGNTIMINNEIVKKQNKTHTHTDPVKLKLIAYEYIGRSSHQNVQHICNLGVRKWGLHIRP